MGEGSEHSDWCPRCNLAFIRINRWFMGSFVCSCHRLIQEEKQSTEARAEELESRVGSLEHMNLLVRGRSLDRQSPELSGRSTPNSPNRDYLHKYHTVSGWALSGISAIVIRTYK